MANIVELRAMSDEKLADMLEDAYAEMFNLRFQNASARLTNTAQVKSVRRNIAQLHTVLNMRAQAIQAAAEHRAIADALNGKTWDATANYVYEDGAWAVTFADENGRDLATATVDLNKKKPRSRRNRAAAAAPQIVIGYNVA
jgi:large subunit ribosomal protein L29